MNKFTLKTTYQRYQRGMVASVPTPSLKGFNISNNSAPQFHSSHTHSNTYDLNKGDEIIVPYKTGGAYRGWFLGLGKTDKYVCLYWDQYNDRVYIVDIMATPLRCDWSKFVSRKTIEVVKDQIEVYKTDNNKTFLLEVTA